MYDDQNRRTLVASPQVFWLLAALLLTASLVLTFAVYPGLGSESRRIAKRGRPIPPPLATPMVDRVLVISVDGLRPDMLLRAETPRIRTLMARGSFTMWANTTDVAVTLPSHVSMLTGVTPEKHGVHHNNVGLGFPAYPTLMEQVKRHRPSLRCGVIAGKAKFVAFLKPGTVDVSIVPARDGDVDDLWVARNVVAQIQAGTPDVLFVHFPTVDGVGHTQGWGTQAQLEAVAAADSAVGMVLDALEEQKLLDKTLIILSADHGGQGLSHGRQPDGTTDPRSRHIPWIIAGPQVREDFDLTRNWQLVVHTEDTFATACYFLGVPLARDIDGRPVLDVIAERELVSETEPRP